MESELDAGLAPSLAEAERSRDRFARSLTIPSWFATSLGAAIAVQIAAAAVGVGAERPVLVVAGVACFLVVAAALLLRFRRSNGVWLGGLASRVVFGTAAAASTSYPVALGLAVWAAYADRWTLVGLCSVAGGAAYGLSGRRWIRRYRAEPAAHARGESIVWLALAGAAALVGVALLVANG
jgi:hypothetical protein